MGVFKEEASVFEEVARKQERIYNDACDYGYPYHTSNIPQEIQELINVVRNFQVGDKRYPKERQLVRNRMEWGTRGTQGGRGVSLDVIIFWEKDGGMYRGTKYRIEFASISKSHSLIRKDCNAFISVDISPYSER